jgi:hypothetical protein
MKPSIPCSQVLDAFLEEAHLEYWAPISPPDTGKPFITVRSIEDLLHCPMADTLILLPLEAKDHEGVCGLCSAILKVLGIEPYLMVFLDQQTAEVYLNQMVSRTGARRVLSFGLDIKPSAVQELGLNDVCYIQTKNLLDVLANPILKRQVWSDVSNPQI